jgi:hypothetical protein
MATISFISEFAAILGEMTLGRRERPLFFERR